MGAYVATRETREASLARQFEHDQFIREIRLRFPGGQVYDYGNTVLVEHKGQMYQVRRKGAYHV